MKQKQTDRINSDAVQSANDYRAALAALGLPYSATPLEVRERIEKMKRDAVDLALLFDEILGDGRTRNTDADDFCAAINRLRMWRRRAEAVK